MVPGYPGYSEHTSEDRETTNLLLFRSVPVTPRNKCGVHVSLPGTRVLGYLLSPKLLDSHTRVPDMAYPGTLSGMHILEEKHPKHPVRYLVHGVQCMHTTTCRACTYNLYPVPGYRKRRIQKFTNAVCSSVEIRNSDTFVLETVSGTDV